jgi:hypothetical protein
MPSFSGHPQLVSKLATAKYRTAVMNKLETIKLAGFGGDDDAIAHAI